MFVVTLGATEWFITAVGSFMSLQIAWCWGLAATGWFITAVGSFTSLQIAWCWGLGANEWFITVVGSFLCTFKITRNLQLRVLSSMLKIELTIHRRILNVLFLIRTQTYWTSPMPSHWIPFYSYLHSYIHCFLVLSIPSESDCLLTFCLSHIGTIQVCKFSLWCCFGFTIYWFWNSQFWTSQW